jgi:16S rRNA (uracil1498-N3)-methyltransferase
LNHFLVKQKNLHPPQPYYSFLRARDEPRRPILREDVGVILRDILAEGPGQPGHPGVPAVVVLVGPQGGWTKEEEEQAVEKGFAAVSLGSHLLRSETAALASLAAMSVFWGD